MWGVLREDAAEGCSKVSSCTSGGIGDGYAVVPEQFVADGDTVVALGHYARKHRSPGGRAVLKMVHVRTMDDGKAVDFQRHVSSTASGFANSAEPPHQRKRT